MRLLTLQFTGEYIKDIQCPPLIYICDVCLEWVNEVGFFLKISVWLVWYAHGFHVHVHIYCMCIGWREIDTLHHP